LDALRRDIDLAPTIPPHVAVFVSFVLVPTVPPPLAPVLANAQVLIPPPAAPSAPSHPSYSVTTGTLPPSHNLLCFKHCIHRRSAFRHHGLLSYAFL
jgi:hypothetical protein